MSESFVGKLKGKELIIPASLLRGDTDFAFPVTGTGVPQVKGGRLRALAVTSSARLKELPDVPTLNGVLACDCRAAGLAGAGAP